MITLPLPCNHTFKLLVSTLARKYTVPAGLTLEYHAGCWAACKTGLGNPEEKDMSTVSRGSQTFWTLGKMCWKSVSLIMVALLAYSHRKYGWDI